MNRLAQLQADPAVGGRSALCCVGGHEVEATHVRGVPYGARLVGTNIQDLSQDAKLGPAVARPSEVTQVKREAEASSAECTNAEHHKRESEVRPGRESSWQLLSHAMRSN